MIKKAVLLTTLTPFLMVFSQHSYSFDESIPEAISRDMLNSVRDAASNSSCSLKPISRNGTQIIEKHTVHNYTGLEGYIITHTSYRFPGREPGRRSPRYSVHKIECPSDPIKSDFIDEINSLSSDPAKTDEECRATKPTFLNFNSYESASASSHVIGSCSYSLSGPVIQNANGQYSAIVTGVSSTGASSDFVTTGEDGSDDFEVPDYLNSLPGGCTDDWNCFSIGDSSYLVDWDSAPDYFEYVGSDGNTYSKPSSGGGSGGDNGGDTGGGDPTDPTNPTDPTDPGGNDGGDSGGDSGGSDDGNDSGDGSGGSSGGGGSTVPEFEFDESGIIEAIRSSGQSNRNAIDALSNDVTDSINNQTNELNSTINTETSRLITETDRQTGRITTGITAQTHSIQNTLDNQTRSLNSTLEGLESSLVDAFGDIRIRFSGGGGGGGSGSGSSDGEGDGEGDGIDGFLDGLVEKLADSFTEEVSDGDDLFNSNAADQTLDNLTDQQQLYNDDLNTLMDEIGDGASSNIADQVTSRLPSLPSGGCTPLQFGPMEISCQAFNTIKGWLSWIVYFWTVVSVVDIFFRSGMRTA